MKILIPTDGSFGYKVMCLVLAGLYAWFLMGLDIDGYIDRANYLIYAQHSDEIFVMYAASSLNTILTNEPVWLLFNIWASRHFTTEDTLRIIIFFSSFVVTFLVLRSYPKYAFLLILFILINSALLLFVLASSDLRIYLFPTRSKPEYSILKKTFPSSLNSSFLSSSEIFF